MLRRLIVLLSVASVASLLGAPAGAAAPGASGVVGLVIIVTVIASSVLGLATWQPSTARWLAIPLALLVGFAVGLAAGAAPPVAAAALVGVAVLLATYLGPPGGSTSLRRYAATAGVGVVSLELAAAAVDASTIPSAVEAGPWGALAIVAVAGLAAFASDADVTTVRARLDDGIPARAAWLCALGLLVTPLWAYILLVRIALELLHLLEPLFALASIVLAPLAGLAALFDI